MINHSLGISFKLLITVRKVGVSLLECLQLVTS